MGNWEIIGTKKIGKHKLNIVKCSTCGETKFLTDDEMKKLKPHKCNVTVIEFDTTRKKSKISGRPVNIKDNEVESDTIINTECACEECEEDFDPYEIEDSDLCEFEDDHEKEVLDRIGRELKNTNNRILRYKTKESIIENLIKERIVNYKPHILCKTKFKPIKKTDKIITYCLADCHYGKDFDDGINRYNTKMTMRRINEFTDFVISDILSHNYETVVISLLGDDIEGCLRASAWFEISKSLIEQTLDMRDIYIDMLHKIFDNCPDTEFKVVYISESNHGQIRLHNTKRDEIPEDLGAIIADGLIKEFGNDTVIAGGFVEMNIFDYVVGFSHGHKFEGKKNNQFDAICNYNRCSYLAIVQAHYHHYKSSVKGIDESGRNRWLTFAPAVTSNDRYAKKLMKQARPGALKLTFTKEDGVVSQTLIRLN